MSANEEELRFKRQHSQIAIDHAIKGNWQDAIAENNVILSSYPNDIDSYNRLGRAYMELDQLSEAKAAYLKAKELDPYNNIATKNLLKLENITEGQLNIKKKIADPRLFIEEIGKSANVKVFNLAEKKILSLLSAGDNVILEVCDNHLYVKNTAGNTIGWVEPRTEKRLLQLIAGGNRYEAIISSASLTDVTILIRETYQDPSQTGIMSFTVKNTDSENGDSSQYSSDDEDFDENGAEYNDEEPELLEDEDEDEDDKEGEEDEV